MNRNISDEDLNKMSVGELSNLITDMTLDGASTAELARVVKRSINAIDEHKK